MMENEIWRDVKEFPNYQVSNLGRIKIVAYQKISDLHYPEQVSKVENITFRKDKKSYFRNVQILVNDHFGENEENNIWKDVKDFPNYQISKDGHIKRLAYRQTRIKNYPEKLVPTRSDGNVMIFHNGNSYCRSAKKLKRIAFGEIVVQAKSHRKKRTTIKF